MSTLDNIKDDTQNNGITRFLESLKPLLGKIQGTASGLKKLNGSPFVSIWGGATSWGDFGLTDVWLTLAGGAVTNDKIPNEGLQYGWVSGSDEPSTTSASGDIFFKVHVNVPEDYVGFLENVLRLRNKFVTFTGWVDGPSDPECSLSLLVYDDSDNLIQGVTRTVTTADDDYNWLYLPGIGGDLLSTITPGQSLEILFFVNWVDMLNLEVHLGKLDMLWH